MSDFDLTISEQLEFLLDQSPFMIYYFDLDLNILYVNQSTQKFTGLDLKKARGRSVLDFIPEESQAVFRSQIASISRENPEICMENRNIDDKGIEHLFLWTDKGIFNPAGELIGYQTLGQDVTEKDEVERALKNSQDRLEEAQRVGKIGVWEWDVINSRTYWSDETFRLCGIDPGAQELGQDFFLSRLIPEYREQLNRGHQYAFQNGLEEFQIEYKFMRGDGAERWFFDQTRIEYTDEGEPSRLLGTILDITESKELQLSLESHIETEKTLLEISMEFMTSDPVHPGQAVDAAVARIGRSINADRSYLVLNSLLAPREEDVYCWFRETEFEGIPQWAGDPSVTPWIMQNLEYSDTVFIPNIGLLKGEGIGDAGFFEKSGIGGFCVVALRHDNQVCGYLCADTVETDQQWSLPNTGFLSIIGEMCVGALERILVRRELEKEKEFLAVTLMSIADGFISLGADGRIELINSRALNLLGLSGNNLSETVTGEKIEDVILIRDSKSGAAVGYRELVARYNPEEPEHREGFYEHPDGDRRILSYSVSPIPAISSRGPGCALVFRDITEEAGRQRKIAYLSFHDSLTGVYNRAFMEEELTRIDTERQLPLSIIMGDVNGLKLANDVFGHKEGDKLLTTIASIITSCCRDEDIIARWGGDEFSVILPKTNQLSADRVCERIKTKCEEVGDTSITPSIALGSATKQFAGENLDLIIREAEDRMYRQKLLDDRSVRSDILSSLKESLFEKSYETEAHTQRMVEIAERFGKSLSLASNLQSDLNLLAIMHDMGKIAVPGHILIKKGKLTEEDWSEIKKHPEAGYRIAQSSQELATIAEYILSHHERWDGTGYPRGLAGREVPELSRIISIIDTYDVMTNGRVYKKGVDKATALLEIERCAGTQFDPGLAMKFIRVMM